MQVCVSTEQKAIKILEPHDMWFLNKKNTNKYVFFLEFRGDRPINKRVILKKKMGISVHLYAGDGYCSFVVLFVSYVEGERLKAAGHVLES